MHHIRKSNHRKMLKPKFYSSSSDDDIDDAPLKWKPIIASFPLESNNAPKQNQSIQSNPIIDSLNTQMSKQHKNLSAEIIQKDEIYNEAEMQANVKMFGSENPGRCLTKEEIKRRKDIILHLVNERLKSKLSQLMGEFGERLNDDEPTTYGNQSPEDDDSVPEAPPPPTFNTTSESSDDDDLDFSMTKEFELYEKEIKEKTSDALSSTVQSHPLDDATTSIRNETPSTQSLFTLATSYNSIQMCASNAITGLHNATIIPSALGTVPLSNNWNIPQQPSTNYEQQNWQQPQNWPMTAQSVDVTPWIPPVGPPQIMEPFPPPMEAEKMSFIAPTQHIPSFIKTNPPPRTGWIPPNFMSNYGSVPQYPNPEWVNNSQSINYMGTAPVPSQRHTAPRMAWNPRENRPSGPYRPPPSHNEPDLNRPPNAFANATKNQFYKPFESPNNVNVPVVSKSNFVNAILPTEQTVAGTSVENKFKQMENSASQKRSYEKEFDKVPSGTVGNSIENKDDFECSNDVTKRMRLNDSKVRKSRFGSPNENRKDPSIAFGNNNRSSSERKEHIGSSMNSKKSPKLEARHEKTNAETLKFLSKYRNTQNMSNETGDVNNGRNEQMKEPIEWTKLCCIVNKLLDLSPNILKNLQSSDRRVKERNDILLILSDDPRKFYAYTDKYGEHNVNWSIKMAQRILFSHGRRDDRITSIIAPFRNVINPTIDTVSKRPSPKLSQKPSPRSSQESTQKPSRKPSQEPSRKTSKEPSQKINRKPSTEPKEWIALCKIVDELLGIPTHIIENLPLSDSRVKERNDILIILSNDPEDFLLHDEKYGAHNVDWTILAAKRILCPNDVLDERIRRIMQRQRQKLMGCYSESSEERLPSNERESRKRSHNKITTNTTEHRSRSIPKEWIALCEIVDKVLSIPLPVRMKLSKRDPRWEQRDEILIVLSDDPDKLESESEKYGPVNVDWAIKSAKKVIFPNGSKDKTIVNKLSPQRKVLLRNRQNDSLKDEKITKEVKSKTSQITKEVNVRLDKQTIQKNDVKKEDQPAVDEQFTNEGKLPVERKRAKKDQESDQIETLNKTSKDNQTIKEPQRCNDDQKPSKSLDNVSKDNQPIKEPQRCNAVQQLSSKLPEKAAKDQSINGPQRPNTDQQKSSKPDIPITPIIRVEVDVTQIWNKLCSIVDILLDLPPNAADKLSPSDKRLIERNEILMVLADDPDNFSKFDANYGSVNVTWAIKSAKKLIYSNGKPNEKLHDVLWKMKDAIMCSEENSKQEPKSQPTNESFEWIYLRKIATKIFQQSIEKNSKQLSKEQLCQQIELLLQLTDEPDGVRTKPICKKIGEGRVEVAIAKCKHILYRMRKVDRKAFDKFDYHRSRMVLYAESLNQSKNIKNYDVILKEVRQIVDQKLFYEIFGDNFNKWTKEQKLERNELAILMIKDPLLLKSNGKYLEMVLKTEQGESTDIISEVEKCLLKCEYIKEKPAEPDASKKTVVCAPIIAKIKDVKFISQFKERKLTQRIHRLIEQFLIAPKPEVFDVCYDDKDGTVDVVCANLMTFNWLKSSVKELDGLWTNGKLKISKAPITRKVLDIDDLKQIKMTFKTVPTESFATIMKQLKNSNSKLNTERWQSIPSNFSDSKKMLIMVDLESLIELERSKREINIDGGTIYFDIKYIGKENFETKC